MLRNQSLRRSYVNWLYLFSGGVALYLIETTTHQERFQNTLLAVVGLCLVTITIDAFFSAHHSLEVDQSSINEKS
jgi:uncharacterized membrane protein YqgA involved in biofilm formation